MRPTVVVPILLRTESLDAGRKSLESAVEWRAFAAARNLADVNIVCVCAVPEFEAYDRILQEFEGKGVQVRRRSFDRERPIVPHARQLLDEAERTFGSRDIVLISAPGSRLVNMDSIAKAVEDIASGSSFKTFIDAGPQRNALPIAALFSAGGQRARGLFLIARDGWSVGVLRNLLGRFHGQYFSYSPVGIPSGKRLDYNVPWMIACLACRCQELRDTLRVEFVEWAT